MKEGMSSMDVKDGVKTAVKVVENSQRDINIAFMNEVAIICLGFCFLARTKKCLF